MDVATAFRDEAERLLQAAVEAVGGSAAPPLEVPPDPSMGDLGMPCFPLAKDLRKAPAAIAKEVAEAVSVAGAKWVAGVRAVGPYVNVDMDKDRLAATLLDDPGAALTCDPVPGTVLLEHTSANPNGPLHVGRARNPIVGDTLARIFRRAGHDVEVQYYMDNLGRQVAQLYWGKATIDPASLPAAARDKPDHDLVRYYQAADVRRMTDPDAAAEIAALVARLESCDPDLLPKVRAVYEACFAGMRQSLLRLGVHYDSVKDESDLVEAGDVESVIGRLAATDRAGVEDDGARYLDLSDHLPGQKNPKFYFTRKDGTSVYATRDVAYHAWKAEHAGDDGRLVNVLGEDHRLQALQVGIALEALGLRRPDVVFYAFVSLPEGKMSTRAARVVYLDDLMDEAVVRAEAAVRERRGDDLDDAAVATISEAVGIAALRFNIAKVQPEKGIQFRWEEALNFEGDSAPYLLYAHARAASLLRKAGDEGLSSKGFDAARAGDGEKRLLTLVAQLPAATRDAADRRAPHRLCTFAVALAAAFNEYYRDHPVLACEDEALRKVRLRTVEVARDALADVTTTLGLPVLDVM